MVELYLTLINRIKYIDLTFFKNTDTKLLS